MNQGSLASESTLLNAKLTLFHPLERWCWHEVPGAMWLGLQHPLFGLWHSGVKNKIVGLEQSPQPYPGGEGPMEIMWRILCARECDHVSSGWHQTWDFQCGLWPLKSTVSHSFHHVVFQELYQVVLSGRVCHAHSWKPNVYHPRFHLKQVSLHLLDCPCFLWFVITPPPTASFCTLMTQIQPSPALISLRPNKPELHSCDFINVSSKSDSETFY